MALEMDVAIIGAGIIGLSAAYYLARKTPHRILLIDPGDPMALTSAQSGNNYRNWWPQPEMVAFMDHSITLMEEIARDTGNRINLTRRGYLLASRNPDISAQHDQLISVMTNPATIRVHDRSDAPGYLPPVSPDWTSAPDGFDFLLDQNLIQQHFPTLDPQVRSILHVRRAGDVSGQQLGQVMLEDARARGARLLRGRVVGIDHASGFTLTVETPDGRTNVVADKILNAAGPHAAEVAAMLGQSPPLTNMLQQKVAFPDPARAIPRDLPFTIDVDPQMIDWSDEERDLLLADIKERRFALEMPGAIHCRPEGGDNGTWIKLGWAYNSTPSNAELPPQLDPRFPEIVLRGAARLHSGLKAYYGKLPRQMVHYGGYYTKTTDNWPLIGPMGPSGAFMACGLSGHGTMAACATGELAATWMTGTDLPGWSSNFALNRFSGQLARPVEAQGLL